MPLARRSFLHDILLGKVITTTAFWSARLLTGASSDNPLWVAGPGPLA